MAPQKNYDHTEFYSTDHATSPWTEPYQTSEMEAMRDEQAAKSQREFDQDTQSPTHDALSDIYNRVS